MSDSVTVASAKQADSEPGKPPSKYGVDSGRHFSHGIG